MAKKSAAAKSAPAPSAGMALVNKRIKERDKATVGKITNLADVLATATFKGKEPTIEVPTRSKSNTIWNKKKRILEMGDGSQDRMLFNLNQAKQFMQTMLHASSIKELIEREKP